MIGGEPRKEQNRFNKDLKQFGWNEYLVEQAGIYGITLSVEKKGDKDELVMQVSNAKLVEGLMSTGMEGVHYEAKNDEFSGITSFKIPERFVIGGFGRSSDGAFSFHILNIDSGQKHNYAFLSDFTTSILDKRRAE